MDALKLVPQLFFDAIGRVIPGLVAIILYFSLFDPSWSLWRAFLDGCLGGRPGAESPVGFVILSLLVFAYVLGHLLSPFTKVVQRIGERLPAKLTSLSSEKYEWLRMHKPDAGSHCAKLRAEFTMYNALASVFTLYVTVLLLVQRPLPVLYILLLIGLALLMGYRGRETRDTFRKSIDHFFDAAKSPPPQPPMHSPSRDDA
jgi:hypothetical protein